MDSFFKSLENLIYSPQIKSFLYCPSNDRIGEVINSLYLDKDVFLNSKELGLVLTYFKYDFDKSNLAFFDVIKNLEGIPLNEIEFFGSLNYFSGLNEANHYLHRAEVDNKGLNKLKSNKKYIVHGIPFLKLDSQIKEMKEVIFYEREFPGLGNTVRSFLGLIDDSVKKEDYEFSAECRDELKRIIQAKYHVLDKVFKIE